MKVGILTFHYSNHNYGAVLQTYASVTILKQKGLLPIVINLLPVHQKKKVDFINKIISFLTPNPFKEFRKKYIPLTSPIKKPTQLIKLNDQFNCFYVGSDQVWRPSMAKNNLYRYFLDFVSDNKIKIAYASSFGLGYWEPLDADTEKITILLKRFYAISVREKTGIEICKNIFHVNAVQVLDPTLLLNSEDYEQIVQKNNLEIILPSKYASFYLLSDIKGETITKLLMQQLKLPAINLYGKSIRFLSNSRFKYNKVENWLCGIKNATLVVTDSYHCMIFAIIYKRNFVCLPNQTSGIERVKNLLKNLNLEDRLCNDEIIDFNKYLQPIEYEIVEQRLAQLRKESFSFLDSALNQKR